MNEATLAMLADIQALALTGFARTGVPMACSTCATEIDGALLPYVSVTIMRDGEEPWSYRGADSPYRVCDEMTLEQLRGHLSAWIEANEKEQAA